MERAGQWSQPGARARTESQCINEAANPSPASVPCSPDQSVKRQSSTSTLIMSNLLWAPFPLGPHPPPDWPKLVAPVFELPFFVVSCTPCVWVAPLVCGLHSVVCNLHLPGLRQTPSLVCNLHLPGLRPAPSLFVGCTTPSLFVGCTTLPVCLVGLHLHVCGLHMPSCVGCTPSVWVAPHFVCVAHHCVCVAPHCVVRPNSIHCARASKSALPTQSVPAPVEKNWCADLRHCTKLASDLLPTKHPVAMPLISPHLPSFLRSKDLDAGVSATSPPPKGDPTLHKPWEETPPETLRPPKTDRELRG